MITKRNVIVSNSYNPYFNLAFEEVLLNTMDSNEIILYLWRNENTVVIGRNQNPWKECNLEMLDNINGKIARRLSGGGAVYHDLGNLNFTFLMREENENLDKQLSVIITALKEIGINAKFSGRNDILVEDKKISGNAFYREDGKYYHHGTLLFNVDMEILPKILTPSIEKLESKGIDSVKSRVINLKECRKDLTIEMLTNSLINAFEATYGTVNSLSYVNEDSVIIEDLTSKYFSDEWIYRDCPRFNVSVGKHFKEGKVELNIKAEDGKIKKCKIYTDSLLVKEFSMIESLLEGCNFNKTHLLARIKASKESSNKNESMVLNMIEEIIEDTIF